MTGAPTDVLEGFDAESNLPLRSTGTGMLRSAGFLRRRARLCRRIPSLCAGDPFAATRSDHPADQGCDSKELPTVEIAPEPLDVHSIESI